MSDRAEVLYALFLKELGEDAGIVSDDLTVIFSELADETGEVDPGILNNAEERAVAWYNREYQPFLGPLEDEDIEAFYDLIRENLENW